MQICNNQQQQHITHTKNTKRAIFKKMRKSRFQKEENKEVKVADFKENQVLQHHQKKKTKNIKSQSLIGTIILAMQNKHQNLKQIQSFDQIF